MFETPLRNWARSLFLVVLQPIDCKLASLVKIDFLKISGSATFWNVPMDFTKFPKELQNAKVFPVTLLSGDSTTDLLQAILKILGTLRRNL